MSNEPKVDLAGVDELVGRLRATYVRSVYAPTSGTGTPITRSPLLKEEVLINPTGPEAATALQSFAAQLAEARAENEKLKEFARAVIRYAGSGCDDYLADKARAALKRSQQ